MATPTDPFLKKGFLEALAKLGANGQLGQGAGMAGGYAQSAQGMAPASGIFGGTSAYAPNLGPAGAAAAQQASGQAAMPSLQAMLAEANQPAQQTARLLGQKAGSGLAGEAAAGITGQVLGSKAAASAGTAGLEALAGAGGSGATTAAARAGLLARFGFGGAAGAGAGGMAGLASGVLPGLIGTGVGMAANALTPSEQRHTMWTRFLQGAAPGAGVGFAAGTALPGVGNTVGAVAGGLIGGIGNVVKSAHDDADAKESLSNSQKALDGLDKSGLNELQRKQFDILLASAMGQVDKQYEDKESGEYAQAKKGVLDNASQMIESAKLQNALNPEANQPAKKGFTPGERMAMQAAIAQFVTPIIDQSRQEIAIGNRSLMGIADRTGGELGENMRSQAVIRAQGNSAQNAAFVQSLGAQMSLQDLAYQRALNQQVAQMQTGTMLSQMGQQQGGMNGGLMGQQQTVNPLLAQLAQR